jgi:quinol monooxygenase YgiN
MPIKVIVEFNARPGGRTALKEAIDAIHGSLAHLAKGWVNSDWYEVPGDPDMLVEISDWESLELRNSSMQVLAETNAFAPLMDLMAAPFRITVIRPLA